MNKIKFLSLYTFMAVSSLQGAAEYPIQVLIKHDGQTPDKQVIIERDGNRITSFDAQLLREHDFAGILQFSHLLEMPKADAHADDEALKSLASTLFENLNDHQINVLAKALNEDNTLASAQAFVESLDPNDAAWLANKANFANISNMYKALTTHIANNPEQPVKALYDTKNINYDVANDILDIQMKPIMKKIQNNPCTTILRDNTIKSVAFNSDNSKLLVTRYNDVILLDLFDTTKKTTLYTKNPELDSLSHNYPLYSASFNRDDSKVLIRAQGRIVVIDLKDQNKQTVLHTGEVHSAIFSSDGNKVLIATLSAVILIDLTNLQQMTLYNTNPGDHINEISFSPDSNQVLIRTSSHLILINLIDQDIIELYTIQERDHIRSAVFNADSSQILIATDYKAILIDPKTKNQRAIYNGTYIDSAIFTTDSRKILIKKPTLVILLDIEHSENQTILFASDQKLDGDIKSVIITPDNSKVIIRTNKRVILIDRHNPHLFKELYKGKPLSVAFSINNDKVLIGTGNRILICQISYSKQLNGLNVEQKIFLIKASETWNENRPYIIQDDNRIIYESLPNEFKRPDLFEIAAQ